MVIRQLIRGFTERVFASGAALWLPNGDVLPRGDNILVLLDGPEKGRRILGFRNIITDDGDVYYAQEAAGETPTNAFTTLFLSAVGFSPPPSKTSDAGDLASVIAGASKINDATYPKTNDDDADNTGAALATLTHRFSFAAADFSAATIEGLSISTAAPTWGSGADPLLNAVNQSPTYSKTATDTLKIFVNHSFLGV